MGNSRKACTYAVGMLGVLAFYGLGCKSPEPPIVQVDPAVKNAEKALKEKVDNDPALKDIRPDVPVVLDALNQKCQIDTQFCKSILPFVGDIARSTSVGSSPLKVRGGAMTVFAENNEGWQGDGSTNPWCVSL